MYILTLLLNTSLLLNLIIANAEIKPHGFKTLCVFLYSLYSFVMFIFVMIFFVDRLVGQVRMCTRGVFEFSFMIIIWLYVMMYYASNWDLFYEFYFDEHLWELEFWQPMLFFGCLSCYQIWSLFLLWYGTQLPFVSFWEVSLGAHLWEWLEIRV